MSWSIRHALNANLQGCVIVSTDDPKIEKVALAEGAQVPFLRPAELASDEAATELVLLHALNHFQTRGEEFDAVVLLQPTSPLRLHDAVKRAGRQFEMESVDSIVGVSPCSPFLWRYPSSPRALYNVSNRQRRQNFRPEEQIYRENGSIYITKTDVLRRDSNRIGGRVSLFLMSAAEGCDVDTEEDLLIVDALLKALPRTSSYSTSIC